MHLEHKAFEMQIIYAPINLPEVSSRLSQCKSERTSKLYLKCPELPGNTQKAGMYNGVGPAAAANKFEFSCLDMRSPRALAPYCMSWLPSLVATCLNLDPWKNSPLLETSKNGIFFCIQRWMRGPCPSILTVTVEKQPPKPRVRGSMYPAGFAGRDEQLKGFKPLKLF